MRGGTSIHHIKMRSLSAILLVLVAITCVSANENEIIERQPKLGFDTITRLAQDLLSRSTSSSQVLSLNLTNLVILLVIKALIFGAGHLGLGGHEGLGRSVDSNSEEQSLISESEIMLMLSYMKSDATQKYSCLHYAACKDPKKAKDYLMAARFLNKGAQMFNVSSYDEKYKNIFTDTQEAIDFGTKGYDCSVRYSCQDES